MLIPDLNVSPNSQSVKLIILLPDFSPDPCVTKSFVTNAVGPQTDRHNAPFIVRFPFCVNMLKLHRNICSRKAITLISFLHNFTVLRE